MEISILQLFISVILFLILFFGIGFILNMLLRMTWVMAIIYPIVIVFVIDRVPFIQYFRAPGEAFSDLGNQFVTLHITDIIILVSGFIGAILSGYIMRVLREKGYRMF